MDENSASDSESVEDKKDYKKRLKKCKKKIESKQDKIEELKLSVVSLEEQLKDEKEKKKKLKLELKEVDFLKAQLEKEKEIGRNFEEQLKKYSEKQEKQEKSNSKDKKPMKNQYDIIIKIDSLLSANQSGFEVIYQDKKQIDEWSQKQVTRFGIIGRENIGKTWLINKLCHQNFPSEYYCNTEGLSIKYSNEKNQMNVFLDSAGVNGAIYFYNLDIFSKYDAKLNIDENRDHDGARIKKNDFERIREKMINDRSMTEYFIENFILYVCNIIIIMVEQLNQYDQKIIERIKSFYSETKKIIIVHNYVKYERKDTVLQKASYEIEGAFAATKYLTASGIPYYLEKSEKKSNNDIFHMIIGKEGFESGEYFNKSTLKFISKNLMVESKMGKFNVLKKLNEFWLEKNGIYFNIFREENKDLPLFKEIIKNEKTYFFLDFPNELMLKPAEFSVLGTLREIDVPYQVVILNKPLREKIFYLELPGYSKKPNMSFNQNKQILTLHIQKKNFIEEKKEQDGKKEDRNEFITKIKIGDDGIYKANTEFTKMKDGVLTLKFEEIDPEHEI